jgi:hypothetical protein
VFDGAATRVARTILRVDDARRLWSLLEPLHAVTYFTVEARTAADAVGLRGFWMAYAAQRAAPLGAVGPEVAHACFHGFHRLRIERALPDAWDLADPARCLTARSVGAGAALHRLLGEEAAHRPEIAEAAGLAGAAAILPIALSALFGGALIDRLAENAIRVALDELGGDCDHVGLVHRPQAAGLRPGASSPERPGPPHRPAQGSRPTYRSSCRPRSARPAR